MPFPNHVRALGTTLSMRSRSCRREACGFRNPDRRSSSPGEASFGTKLTHSGCQSEKRDWMLRLLNLVCRWLPDWIRLRLQQVKTASSCLMKAQASDIYTFLRTFNTSLLTSMPKSALDKECYIPASHDNQSIYINVKFSKLQTWSVLPTWDKAVVHSPFAHEARNFLGVLIPTIGSAVGTSKCWIASTFSLLLLFPDVLVSSYHTCSRFDLSSPPFCI